MDECDLRIIPKMSIGREKSQLTTEIDLEMRFCPNCKQVDRALVPGTVLEQISTWATVSHQRGPSVGSSTGLSWLIRHQDLQMTLGQLRKLLMIFINKKVLTLNAVLSIVFNLNKSYLNFKQKKKGGLQGDPSLHMGKVSPVVLEGLVLPQTFVS